MQDVQKTADILQDRLSLSTKRVNLEVKDLPPQKR